MNILKLHFNGAEIHIKLLQTKAAELWVNAFKNYKAYYKRNGLDKDYKPTHGSTFPQIGFSPDRKSDDYVDPYTNLTQQDCVDLINKAIADANSCISGKQFPHTAFLGMGWNHTNLLHRCFTVAVSTMTNWQHFLHKDILGQLKKDSYQDKISFANLLTPEYDIKEGKSGEFRDAIERINKYIHHYEEYQQSGRASNLVKETNFENGYLQLEWDNYKESGEHSYFYFNRLTDDEVRQSIPNNFYDYDVFLGKSIAGKDYEFCFADFDNPLEFDITNLDHINGSLKIYFGDIKEVYHKSQFTDWCDGYGLEKYQCTPIPIGKVIKNTLPITMDHVENYSDSEVWSDHSPKLASPLNEVVSELVYIPDNLL